MGSPSDPPQFALRDQTKVVRLFTGTRFGRLDTAHPSLPRGSIVMRDSSRLSRAGRVFTLPNRPLTSLVTAQALAPRIPVRERARRMATFESHHHAVDLPGPESARAFGLGRTRNALRTPSVVSRTVRASPHCGRNKLGLSSKRPATPIVRPSPRLASTSTKMSVTRGPRCR